MQMAIYCKIVQTPWKDCRGGRLAARWLALALLFGGGGMALYLPPRAGALTPPASCPNEVLRSESNSGFLADCRAYEMVTPPYKEGYSLRVQSYASDGERVILKSLATLAGDPGSTEVLVNSGVYLDTRTAVGWHLSPLNPPLSEFAERDMLAAEADDGDSLWSLHTPGQPLSSHGIYVRSPAGAFSFVGPLSPTERSSEGPSNVTEGESNDELVATTNDFSHIVVEAKSVEGHWPFDGTTGNANSLYEYSGIANKEPVLVGVVGGKGSRQLIATCGTTLGAGTSGAGTSDYNAISRDGETIFFTVVPCGSLPETAEVYARLHGGSLSAVPGETVDVSENECTTECGEVSGKNFEGASEDGTRVFFTSTQKLTNDAIEGTVSGNAAERRGCAGMPPSIPAEPHGCTLYEYDFLAPLGKRLKSISIGGEVLGVTAIAEDGSHVYYVSRAAVGSAGKDIYGREPVPGQPNLYVYDSVNSSTAFVATLAEGDESDWLRPKRRSAVLAGREGRVLLFASSLVGLTPDARSGAPQLFEYRSAVEGEAAELVRVTKGEEGFNEDGNGPGAEVELSFIENIGKKLGYSRDFKTTTNEQDISVDGRTIVFAAGSLSPLATAASQHCRSLYEFHSNGALSDGSVHLMSDGSDTQLYTPGVPCVVLFQAMDAGAANVLFESADPLLGSDVDGLQFDIYDARVDGGFGPSPGVGECGEGLCEGAVSGPPLAPVAGAIAKDSVAPAVSAAPRRAKPKPRKGKRRKSKACERRRAGERGCSRRHEAKAAGMLSGRSR